MSAYQIFISYAHEDETHKNALTQQLKGLQRQGLIAPWNDRCIDGGASWRGEIAGSVDACDLALLLVSPAFIASDFIYAEELARLLARREQEGIRVVPIIVKPCAWRLEEPIESLQARPKDAKAIVTFPEEDGARAQAWTDIVEEIARWAKAHTEPEHVQNTTSDRAFERLPDEATPAIRTDRSPIAPELPMFKDHCVVNPAWLTMASHWGVEDPPALEWHGKISWALQLVADNTIAIDTSFHRLRSSEESDRAASMTAFKQQFYGDQNVLEEVLHKAERAYVQLFDSLRDVAQDLRVRALHTFAGAASLQLVAVLQRFEGRLVDASGRVIVRLFPDLPGLRDMRFPAVGLPYRHPVNGLVYGWAGSEFLQCRVCRGRESDYGYVFLPRRDAETFQDEHPGPAHLYWGWVVPEWLLFHADLPPGPEAWWISVLRDEVNRERYTRHRESPWSDTPLELRSDYGWSHEAYELVLGEREPMYWILKGNHLAPSGAEPMPTETTRKEPPMLPTRLPEPEARRDLQKIAGCDDDSRGMDVVFIHGLGGDAWTTWMHNPEDIASFWPNWLAEDVPGIGLWTLGYAASGSKWQEESMALADRGGQVLDLLANEGLGERPLAFITHSMGGIVAKQILRLAQSYGVDRWKSISDRTAGIAFIATPHSGAHVANFAELASAVYRTNEHVKELAAHDPRLRELHGWFLNYLREHAPVCRTYCEKRELRPEIPLLGIKLPKGILVVDETSAEPNIPGERAVPLDEDHISICKPTSREAQLYKGILRLLKDCQKHLARPR